MALLGRRHPGEGKWKPGMLLFAITAAVALATYVVLSPLFSDRKEASSGSIESSPVTTFDAIRKEKAACCRGIEHQELWGSVVVWGSSHKVNSSAACCESCKARCPSNGPCKCNSWVYCGDRLRCGSKFGECWLKNQEDPLSPDVQDARSEVSWTSGLVYGKDMGIVELNTAYGSIRMKLLPDCAPLSVAYILELLKLRHCAGCQLYRAEGRGDSWDAQGNPIKKITKGPPQGLVQGSMQAEGFEFKELPNEACPSIKRGMVGWIEGGPDFFISLANHREWYPKHSVFGKVLDEDMEVVEKMVKMESRESVWSDVRVMVLNTPISFKIHRSKPLFPAATTK